MDLLKFVAPATAARRSHMREARQFAATVTPGRTYWSVIKCRFPWGDTLLLQEHTASKRKAWPSGEYTFDHLSASGLWLSYGPIHDRRPAGMETLDEYRRRGDLGPNPARALRDAKPTPAGV